MSGAPHIPALGAGDPTMRFAGAVLAALPEMSLHLRQYWTSAPDRLREFLAGLALTSHSSFKIVVDYGMTIEDAVDAGGFHILINLCQGEYSLSSQPHEPGTVQKWVRNIANYDILY